MKEPRQERTGPIETPTLFAGYNEVSPLHPLAVLDEKSCRSGAAQPAELASFDDRPCLCSPRNFVPHSLLCIGATAKCISVVLAVLCEAGLIRAWVL